MKSILILIGTLVLSFLLSCSQKADVKTEKARIEAVLTNYDRAISAKNMEAIAAVFAHSADVVVVGTSKLPSSVTQQEYCQGWDCAQRMFQFMFSAYEQIRFSVRDQKLILSPAGDAALFSRIEKYEVVIQDKQMVVDSIRSTGALVKYNSQWKLVQVHCSLAMQ